MDTGWFALPPSMLQITLWSTLKNEPRGWFTDARRLVVPSRTSQVTSWCVFQLGWLIVTRRLVLLPGTFQMTPWYWCFSNQLIRTLMRFQYETWALSSPICCTCNVDHFGIGLFSLANQIYCQSDQWN